ncbi:MAG: prepilin peptidase [Actinomycetales bacterium]|jgi:leader peptidase (prepilin peptidase)/N-methyltransferase|uniref:Prepilin peptidase n=1 Tax=Candidatus Phosphoribacter hodrii TaxID=2953743 RepID=A0A934X4Y1_9MICO|nr:prepilin peptidase [Candidatus Phosphoribacter hodrii]MBP8837261.1 prepilin peptidase [Dermatophilaceae bacterium]OPZ56617.1 MAG: Type IV leader peptidase family protein [bacterium ADurb.BinA028]MBK7272888.1 prepilin peptidase [Candidatus Phosphoribacter hodrii]MBL0004745.1 prepilin peptidase [Candidatus Phosphoribacter hodrii]
MTVFTQTGPWWLVLAAVVVGSALGGWLRRELVTGGYRLDDEWDRPVLRRPWLLVALVPLVWGLLAWRVGGPGTLTLLPALLLVGFAGVALSWIDIDVHRLPHGLTYPLGAGVLGIVLVAGAVSGSWTLPVRALVSGVAAYLVLLVLALISRGQFGLGDVTVGGILGIALGSVDGRLPWWGLMLAFVISGLVSVVGLATRRLTMRTDLAFGPYLLVGALVAVLLG